MQKHSKRKAKIKHSPYRINTGLVLEWKERLGLSDVHLSRELDVDPSTVSRTIANQSASPKVQIPLAELIERLSKRKVRKTAILLSRFDETVHTAA